MKRQVPEFKDEYRVPQEVLPRERYKTQIREYELITPLFGGGVEPGENDELTPVRGSEVRGHLRFWWRATRGGQSEGNLKRLQEAEGELWGTASAEDRTRPLPVQISVNVINAGREDQPFEVVAKQRGRGLKSQPRVGSQVPPYAAFPLQPDNETLQRGRQPSDIKLKSLRAGIKFTLEIAFPKERATDVEAALWAWETFGGIGARTRRGFGALSLIKVRSGASDLAITPVSASSLVKAIKQGLIHHVSTGKWPENVPHLNQQLQIKLTNPQANAVIAWQKLIGKLEAFRQFRKDSRYGKSLWPEASAIRRLVNDSPENPGKFPRAVFGLPIVFHFQHDHDPDDAMLVGWQHERLASPLILRPLVCAGNQAVGLAAILIAPTVPPGGLVLENEIDDDPVSSTLTPAEAAAILPLNGQTDVLNAFLRTL